MRALVLASCTALALTAAAGITGVARTTGASFAPVLAGLFLSSPALAGAPFVIAGALKLAYDMMLYRLFRHVTPPEENKPGHKLS